MTSNLKEYKLKDVCLQITDGVHNTVIDDPNGEYFLLSCKNIKNGNIIVGNQERRISLETLQKLRQRTKTQKDDVLLTSVGTIGEAAIITDDEPRYEFQRSVAIFKPNKEKIVPRFLLYSLNNKKRFLQYSAEGAVQQCLFINPLKDFKILLPPLETQQKIAKVLSAIDDKIELNNSINKNLTQQMMLLYKKLSTQQPWEYVAIGEIAEKIAMGPFGSNIKVSTFVSEGVPIISGNHLRGYFLEEPNYNYITEEHAEKLKNSVVYPGDIIFTHAGNIGQVALIPELCKYSRYILSQRQFYLRCNRTLVLPEYVNLFFHSKEGYHELLSYANQTGVPSIAQPATNLKKIKLPLPNIKEQNEWLKTIKPLTDYYQLNYLKNEQLTQLRDTLLPKLMSGEIDVDKVEII